MDIFFLFFISSFIALILTLAVMYIRKHINVKDDVAKGSKHIGWVSDVQVKWKETLPKHSTRIKLRNKRKEKK